MPALIGNVGEREIVIDLNPTGALTIQAASIRAKIGKIFVSGTAGASSAPLVLRRSVITTGPIIFKLKGTLNVEYTVDLAFDGNPPNVDGLFVDALGTAWLADSVMIIYLR